MALLYLLDEPVPYTVTYDDGTSEAIVPRWQLHFHRAMERLPRVSENHALYQIEEEDIMAVTSVEAPVTQADEDQEGTALERRVEQLERRVAELEEWLEEMASDVLDGVAVA